MSYEDFLMELFTDCGYADIDLLLSCDEVVVRNVLTDIKTENDGLGELNFNNFYRREVEEALNFLGLYNLVYEDKVKYQLNYIDSSVTINTKLSSEKEKELKRLLPKFRIYIKK